MWRLGRPSTGSGIGLICALVVFFPVNAVFPAHGWVLAAEVLGALVAGQLLGVGIAVLYHRLFDVRDV
jgi:ABC-type xylose transport system permease subunit